MAFLESSRDSPVSLRGPMTTLNLPSTPFLGRERELATVTARCVDPAVRLLTLTGPAGIGKTRLAIAAATSVRDDFHDDVWFVPLAAVRSPDLVLPSIAQALDVRDQGQDSLRMQLAAVLRDRHCLLVLDNFEQVAAAAPAVAELLSACPELHVLVTSREVLRLSTEHTYTVPPLALPEIPQASLAGTANSDAVRLFVERMRVVRPSFALTETTATAIVTICRHLEGLPLAIELAAARTRVLSPQGLLARLEHRLPLLSGGPRDAPARQQTMNNAVAWSYDLLSDEEQTLFRRLAVFAGSFTLEAAEVIGSGLSPRSDDELPFSSVGDYAAVVDRIMSLHDKSLLQYGADDSERERYWMLETIREYAEARLAAAGKTEAMRQTHAAYFLSLAERYQQMPFFPEQPASLVRLDAEQANLRAALLWLQATARTKDVARLAGALGWYWFVHGDVSEGREWLERALEPGDAVPAPERFPVMVTLGMMLVAQGELSRAREILQAGLTIARATGDAVSCAQALIALGVHATVAAEFERGSVQLTEALAVARSLGDSRLARTLASAALANLGVAARGLGQLDAAAAYHQEALAGNRAVGSQRGELLSLYDLGDLARERGDLAGASRSYHQSLALALDFGEQRAIAEALEGLALVAVVSDRMPHAARLFGAAEQLRERTGLSMRFPLSLAAYEQGVTAARAALAAPAFAAAWEAGRALALDEVVAEALAGAAGSAAPAVSLTPREAQILPLVAAGRTNQEIGAALFLSHRTVEHHVARLFAKLGIRTRREAADAARAAGLLPAEDE